MADFDRNRFQSKNQEYATPPELFEVLNSEFSFTLDVCADEENRKVDKYYSKNENSLIQDWIGICWMNPPYKDLKTWVLKAYEESIKHGSTIVCLIPARTNTSWWHDYCMKGEIRFIKGRPKFEGCKHGLPQPLAIVIFGGEHRNNYKSVNLQLISNQRFRHDRDLSLGND
jgi:phage N-6-adenine-methyltransferase